MPGRLLGRRLLAAALVAAAPFACPAQQPPQQATTPPPPAIEKEEQEPVRVYTEEVLLPVVAYDGGGRFDPTLAVDDVLVLEDGTPQRVRSVRRVPANILIVSDMGGQVTETRGMNTTREIALRLVEGLGAGDRVAVIQNSRRVEVLADWTEDASRAARVLRTKLFSSDRSRLSRCLLLAAEKLKERPAGNTHVVIFTDGQEARSDEAAFAEALGRVTATQATAHVIAYSAAARAAVKTRNSNLLDLDFEMKRWRKQYAEATKRNDERLALLVREMGGRLLLPLSEGEAVELAAEMARDIGAQYVVTYAPKRPFADAAERRSVRVSSRKIGLRLTSPRTHVRPPPRLP